LRSATIVKIVPGNRGDHSMSQLENMNGDGSQSYLLYVKKRILRCSFLEQDPGSNSG